MTLRNSLLVSIVFHVLIFGSALAFVRYDGAAFPLRLDAVQVSLVTSENFGSPAATSRKRERDLPVHEKVIEEQHPPVMPAGERIEQPATPQTDGAADIADADQSQPGPDIGQEGRVRSGLAGTEYLGLFEAIEKVKKYPRLARERGMEGVVRIRFRLDRSGGVENIKVVKSSGHEILDRASISAVYRAVPMPYVNGWVDMPMKYVLK